MRAKLDDRTGLVLPTYRRPVGVHPELLSPDFDIRLQGEGASVFFTV